ncbi:MAG: bifunctional UDP-N-acetylmuramoyl-tripeptide:D-alanyl-D-alanine ligase/alanine racemase, partial [Bacteroidales bacterium]|nr:bifunctional UDP-N-acetylmuramoyl-tripeptide:D-alanyl-D-alanine ligase/alanine racemase [Bacteroidales bacterium]
MKASQLNSIFRQSTSVIANEHREFDLLLTDSRKLTVAERSIFFAIPTRRNSGFNFVEELYEKGVRNFVVSNAISDEERMSLVPLEKANIWYVPDVVLALQQLAAYNRTMFFKPVIGITGSNGKTIVKDWLSQMIGEDKSVAASPKSYNSQIGVPLSVWLINKQHDVAIIETGISEPGEMGRLANVVQPTIGIFTNIGQVHDENFLSRKHKISEKLKLFLHCETLVYCSDHREIHNTILETEGIKQVHRFTWGSHDYDNVRVVSSNIEAGHTTIRIAHDGKEQDIRIAFADRASAENVMHCVCTMLLMGYDMADVADRCTRLQPIEMRLEINEGINNCTLINDGYSLDINSLAIALEMMQQNPNGKRSIVIMSDFDHSGSSEMRLYKEAADLLQ